ncbi:MAG: transaldolase [Sulfuricurvum sp.]|uniref:transaldolase n=1 Tax=Sulfuricurvum sp. TaxID=2025608 RepID=UPI0026179026|nr:transaldolase [Sulfuricurvum sp.]MDD5160441.1 transaldolase [Sulfuricurvum sp.]
MYLAEARFALWADFIERTFLDEEFKELISKGIINGATSNPAIFKNAILTSSAYKEQLSTLQALSPKEKYEALAVYDIQKAADILRPLYDSGDDGYVSIEVDPFLCDDADGTIAEGLRLHATINRPNVMIKVPATDAGYSAMEALASAGIAVNATLIFSVEQAVKCASAFERASHKASVDTVISVFVSRIDRAIDEVLRTKGVETGKMGILNAADIYNRVEALNVPKCRVLFASTGVKGDEFRASYYIDELLAPNSVNTAPIATIDAFVKGGDTVLKLPVGSAIIEDHQTNVANAGIDMGMIIDQQIREGLEAFKVAFSEILSELE